MASGGTIATGIFLMVLALFGFVIPFTDLGYTIPETDSICQSGVGQIGQFFSSDTRENCRIFFIMTIGIYVIGVSGLILTIAGAVIPGGSSTKKSSSLICAYCNYVAKSENELIDHKAKSHLDKSPFKCTQCDFIGITDEILNNHWKEKHPDKNRYKWYQ